MAAFWARTDVALPSLDDELALYGEKDAIGVLKRLRDLGVTAGALKRGGLGPVAIGWDGTLPTFEPAARVVDTTAAGDSFNGAFLAALLSGLNPPECLLAGHRMASHVIGHPGAIVPPGGT